MPPPSQLASSLQYRGPRLSPFHVALLPSVCGYDVMGCALFNAVSMQPHETTVHVDGLLGYVSRPYPPYDPLPASTPTYTPRWMCSL